MKKTAVIFSFFTLYSLLFVASPAPVWADCYDTSVSTDVATINCLAIYVTNTIKFLIKLAAAVALFFLLFGGIKFVTSGGEPKAVEEAKKTLTYAVFGLVLIFSVWAIFALIKQVTGVDLTVFNIAVPSP